MTIASLAPGERRHYTNGAGIAIRLEQHPIVGYRVEIRSNGDFVKGHTETFETDALRRYTAAITANRHHDVTIIRPNA